MDFKPLPPFVNTRYIQVYTVQYMHTVSVQYRLMYVCYMYMYGCICTRFCACTPYLMIAVVQTCAFSRHALIVLTLNSQAIVFLNSFVGNSAILRRSCYKEATFYLTINFFGVNNTLFRGPRARQFRRSCLQRTFSHNAEMLYSSQYNCQRPRNSFEKSPTCLYDSTCTCPCSGSWSTMEHHTPLHQCHEGQIPAVSHWSSGPYWLWRRLFVHPS